MINFDDYLLSLAKHEEEKTNQFLTDPRGKILVHAGVRLNWMGDFFANPELKWSKQTTLDINQIQFTGTAPDWNEILIDRCGRSPKIFLDLVSSNPIIKEKFINELSFDPNLPILVRRSEDEGRFKVLDGMHRFLGAILNNQTEINVFYPLHEDSILPWCEAHVVYDLIRGFQRNANDSEGEKELYYSLKLLLRSYGNVKDLLVNRFNANYVSDDRVQKIILKLLDIDKKL
jgi:hypothetical protein